MLELKDFKSLGLAFSVDFGDLRHLASFWGEVSLQGVARFERSVVSVLRFRAF